MLGVFFDTDKHANILTNFAYKVSKDVCRFADNIVLQVQSYIEGDQKIFNIPCRFEYGTDFEQKIWECLKQIPYGETTTYKQIAEAIGNPKAVRAVANAIGRNPISIIIPCHRVIGSDGKLRGYAGGVDIKQKLLGVEAKG